MTARSKFTYQSHFLIGFRFQRCSLWSIADCLRLLGVLFALFWATTATAADGDRVALILSAQDYVSYGRSQIDADTVGKIGETLQRHGFETDIVKNANNAVSRAKLRDFAKKAENARVAIVVLAGHGVGSRGRSYFLPSNVEIRRASDLLSRAVAVSSVAQIAARAKNGAVFFFMTVADISSTQQGISARPLMNSTPKDNVVVVFSTSKKVPVSRVSSVSRQAALDFADAVGEKPLMMSTLVGAASAGDVGKIIGTAAEIDLSTAPRPPAEAKIEQSKPSQEEIEARREAELRARDAEKRASEAEARARDAEARAKLEAKRARDAQQSAALASDRADEVDEPEAQEPKQDAGDTDALKVVEALLGRSKKKQLQRRMRKLGFYNGPIDAIFGDLTRQGIREFQADSGEAATGYLTPKQIQSLIEG